MNPIIISVDYVSIIRQTQSEQLKNPLQRYKKVREFYAEAINDNCVFYNLYSFPSENNDPLSEQFPKSLFHRYYGGHDLFEILNPQYYKVLPISFELAIEICQRYKVAESNIQEGFSWDHFYAVCPSITNPLSTFEELNEIWYKEWISCTPEWWYQAVAELNNPDNL